MASLVVVQSGKEHNGIILLKSGTQNGWQPHRGEAVFSNIALHRTTDQ